MGGGGGGGLEWDHANQLRAYGGLGGVPMNSVMGHVAYFNHTEPKGYGRWTLAHTLCRVLRPLSASVVGAAPDS